MAAPQHYLMAYYASAMLTQNRLLPEQILAVLIAPLHLCGTVMGHVAQEIGLPVTATIACVSAEI